VAKVALRIGCAKQSKNLKRYLKYVVFSLILFMAPISKPNFIITKEVEEEGWEDQKWRVHMAS
jgi:hypothetical protein